LSGLAANQRLKLSLVFASFEGATPAVGLLAGGLLVAYGLYTGLARKDDEAGPANTLVTAHGAALVLLGLSVSLDELALGSPSGCPGYQWCRPWP
jgi:putative Mn2+ efflux pump MntP